MKSEKYFKIKKELIDFFNPDKKPKRDEFN